MIYNRYLNINDYRLKFITWDEIVSAIMQRLQPNDTLDTTNINIYTINNKICQQSNIIISMIRKGFITMPKYSKFLEWNYIFCIIDPMTIIRNYSSNQISNHLQSSSTISNDINLDNLQFLNNKDIYNRYTEPLISNEIELLENTNLINQNLINQNLISNIDNISISSNSPNSTTTLGSGIGTGPFVSDSLIQNNNFDSILYNTLINGGINNVHTTELKEYLQKVNYRINLVICINIFAIPFIITVLGLYLFIKYGEKLYGNPGMLFQRRININTLWKMRYYNELPNLFKDRIGRIERNMDKIINLYKSPIWEIICRFLVFTIGSIFITLLILSFIANEHFSQLEIISGHNVIWFLGICGTLLLILNKISHAGENKLNRIEQIRAFEELREDLITINPNIINIEDREYLVSLIKDIYQSRIINIFYEIINLIIAPYYLWKWKRDIALNCTSILELLEYHYQLGNVCKHSIFTNREEIIKNPHMMLSLKEFRANHEWYLPEVLTDLNR
jgi:hypothetical protein